MTPSSLRRGFAIGLVAVVASIVGLGLWIDALNGERLRPEGVAEDWLAAVADTTRKGVRAEAVERAAEIGPVELARPLLDAAGDTGGKRALSDFEVGKASTGVPTRVPYRLHVFGEDSVRAGVVVLVSRGDGDGDEWRVVGLDDRRRDEKVPSEGGPPPSEAAGWLWPAGLVAGLVMTTACSLAVRWATPRP